MKQKWRFDFYKHNKRFTFTYQVILVRKHESNDTIKCGKVSFNRNPCIRFRSANTRYVVIRLSSLPIPDIGERNSIVTRTTSALVFQKKIRNNLPIVHVEIR